jgi:hypothetical protein
MNKNTANNQVEPTSDSRVGCHLRLTWYVGFTKLNDRIRYSDTIIPDKKTKNKVVDLQKLPVDVKVKR